MSSYITPQTTQVNPFGSAAFSEWGSFSGTSVVIHFYFVLPDHSRGAKENFESDKKCKRIKETLSVELMKSFQMKHWVA